MGEPFDIERKEEGFHHLDSCSRVSDRIAASGSGSVVVAETNPLNPLLQPGLLRAQGLQESRTFSDDRGCKHEFGVERVTSARSLVRSFRRGRLPDRTRPPRTTLSQPERGPQILMMLELRLNCLPRCAFVHYAYVGRRVR